MCQQYINRFSTKESYGFLSQGSDKTRHAWIPFCGAGSILNKRAVCYPYEVRREVWGVLGGVEESWREWLDSGGA